MNDWYAAFGKNPGTLGIDGKSGLRIIFGGVNGGVGRAIDYAVEGLEVKTSFYAGLISDVQLLTRIRTASDASSLTERGKRLSQWTAGASDQDHLRAPS